MCIRDSKMLRVVEALEDSDDVQNVWANGDISDEVLGQLEAVSYTHLRAHETVLDLVCRLLLAKQTNQPRLPSLSRLCLSHIRWLHTRFHLRILSTVMTPD